MNIVYLKKDEIGVLLPRSDRRHFHVARILRKKAGDSLSAGCGDGTLGTAVIETLDEKGISLSYRPEREAPALYPLRLLLGFPRPIQAGRILKDLTCLGVSSVWFALTELGEKSYAESDFFRNRDFESHLVEGAEQCGNPRLPEVRTFWSLKRALDGEECAPECSGQAPRETQSEKHARIVLHKREGTLPLGSFPGLRLPVTLAIGSERGWTEGELALLGERGFSMRSLGDRVLKTETAALAAVSVVLSRCGLM